VTSEINLISFKLHRHLQTHTHNCKVSDKSVWPSNFVIVSWTKPYEPCFSYNNIHTNIHSYNLYFKNHNIFILLFTQFKFSNETKRTLCLYLEAMYIIYHHVLILFQNFVHNHVLTIAKRIKMVHKFACENEVRQKMNELFKGLI
jgi:hypothetical protein